MKYKNIIVLVILVVSLLAVSAVSAADNATSDVFGVDETTTDIVEVTADDTVSVENDNQLSANDSDVGTFDDLANEINAVEEGGVLNLTKDYKYVNGSTEGIQINKAITIDGQGHKIDAKGKARIFNIQTDSVILNNITFINGKATDGGAINWNANLGTVLDCNFSNNTATGVGGAIHWENRGESEYGLNFNSIRGCSFVNNTANNCSAGGGAVYFSGGNKEYTVAVENCHFVKNNAPNGGAVYFLRSYVTAIVTNCYFINNTATGDETGDEYDDGGGAVFFSSNCAVTNCNFINNTASAWGGAIKAYYDANITNSTFCDNDAHRGGAVHLWSGDVTNCYFINNTATGDKYYDGGGAVYSETSGDVTNCNFTGNTATNKAGAIYMYGTVTNCNFTNNTASGDGGAVYFNGKGDVTNCNFAGNNATGDGGAVYFENSGNVTNCNFTDNSAGYGGAISYLHGEGNVKNCNFAGNNATGDGGAISMDRGNVSNCNFTNNKATGNISYGGAVYFSNPANVSNCNFAGNSANAGGAAHFSGTATMTNCNFTGNTAIEGGAIGMPRGTVSNCNFAGNSAKNGGAIYGVSAVTVTNCNFKNNHAKYEGGAIFIYSGNVSNCNFTGNDAYNYGAIYIYFGTVSNCNFINDRATKKGGAIYIYSGTVSNCDFTDHSATNGGAIYLDSAVTVTNCNFVNNKATGVDRFDGGGAIFLNGKGTVTNCNFINNQAAHGGAIINLNIGGIDNNCKISSSIFLANKNTFDEDKPVFDNCLCWFGNNASNYEAKQYNYFVDSWLFLDATINPIVGVEHEYSIVFNLKSYNSTSKLITTPDIPNLPDMVFDVSATNGYLSKYFTRLGEPVIFTSTINKDGSIKVSYSGVSYSVGIVRLNLDAPDVSKYYNGSERFIVTLSDSAHKPVSNKNVSITIDGKTTSGITDGAGQFSIPLDLNTGNYIVTSSYPGLIVKSNVNIYSTVEFSNVKGAYKDATFKATILDSAGNPAKGNEVKIKVGDLDLTAVSDSDGVVRVSPDLDAGNYVMSITNPVTGEVKSTDVVISKASSTVSISSATFANGVTLTANILPGNISGEVLFTFNGNQYYSEDVVNSKASITLRNMDSGKYTAVVTFNGNTNYNASSSSQISFDVDEYDYVISAPDVTKDYGGLEKFNITLTKNNVPIANANVKITINGVNYTKSTDNNGKISMDINNLDAGVYGVVVKYNSITANSVIIVNQLSTNIDLSFVKHSSDNVTLTAKITPSVTGELVFTVKGKDYKVNITAGKSLLNLAGMDDGNYSAKAVYKGAVNYKSSTSNTVSFIIDKNSIFIYAPEVTKEYGGPERFNITLTRYNVPVANVNVEITIGGIDYNEITDNEGKISMNISDLNVGVYDIVVKYDSVSAKSVITVNLVSTKISWSPAELTTVYNVNKNLVATLIDSSGNPIVNSKVTIKFSNGKTLTPTTNAKGQVTISTKSLAPVKTYTASITFAGNAIYKKSTATVKITVKKATPKLTAKAKTFKKSVKTKNFVVTLKTNQNKVMKNTKVTLKVNGKTYSAKTNTKGQATFKITKLTKKGKFTATIKYAGSKYYNAKTVKAKITVK